MALVYDCRWFHCSFADLRQVSLAMIDHQSSSSSSNSHQSIGSDCQHEVHRVSFHLWVFIRMEETSEDCRAVVVSDRIHYLLVPLIVVAKRPHCFDTQRLFKHAEMKANDTNFHSFFVSLRQKKATEEKKSQ